MRHKGWGQIDGWTFWRFKRVKFNGWKIFLLRIFINAMKIMNIRNNLI